jgi:hypothetical protein
MDIANPDPQNPNCDDAKAPPQTARVLKTEVQGSNVIITIAVGSQKGVAQNWKGTVLRGDSDTPMDNGDVEIIRVGLRETVGRTKLTTDMISKNNRVKLSPP